jgi:photosynthetic reaction center cytochrome c subunit
MLQMTWQINEQWGAHVGQTGVNCWTCHRGNGIPEYHWFNDVPEPETFVGDRNQQNNPIADTGYSSLPTSAFEAFLDNDYEIRVQGNQALPPDELGVSVMRTEWTYSLMMHFSNSLGVNCTYCHNSRRWGSWEQSPSVRGTAWYGIRMVRQVNNEYMASVQGLFPEYYEGQRRLGPMGDVAKVSCMTCHQGAYRPMLGAPAYEDWPSLAHSPPMAEVAEVYATPEPEVPVEAAPPEAVEGEMVGDGEIVDTVEEAVEAVVEAVEAVEAEAPSAEE